MSQQSSVEWYINNLIDILGDEICNKLTIEQTNEIHNLGNQAVAMHKEEIINANFDGQRLHAKSVTNLMMEDNAEQYYNEIFNNAER